MKDPACWIKGTLLSWRFSALPGDGLATVPVDGVPSPQLLWAVSLVLFFLSPLPLVIVLSPGSFLRVDKACLPIQIHPVSESHFPWQLPPVPLLFTVSLFDIVDLLSLVRSPQSTTVGISALPLAQQPLERRASGVVQSVVFIWLLLSIWMHRSLFLFYCWT